MSRRGCEHTFFIFRVSHMRRHGQMVGVCAIQRDVMFEGHDLTIYNK